MRARQLNVSAVLAGDRYRRELGDLTPLMRSMANDGQMQPIVVIDGAKLLAGERRLEAARRLGWGTIAAYTVRTLNDAVTALRADWASANRADICLHMRITERVAQVEPLRELHARERGPVPKGIARNERWAHQVDPILADLLDTGMTSYRHVRLAVQTARGRRPYPSRPVTDLDRELAQEAIRQIDAGVAVDTVGVRLRAQLGYPRNSRRVTLPTDPDRLPAVPLRVPRSNRRPPLRDQVSAAIGQLLLSVRRLEKLTNDDRWRVQREQIPPAVRLSLKEATDQLNAIQSQIPAPTNPKETQS